jgi:hypothetical protein
MKTNGMIPRRFRLKQTRDVCLKEAHADAEAAELATMIRIRLDEKELRIGVFSNSNSWNAKVYASVNAASLLQFASTKRPSSCASSTIWRIDAALKIAWQHANTD